MGIPGIDKIILKKNKIRKSVQPESFIRLCVIGLRTDIDQCNTVVKNRTTNIWLVDFFGHRFR